MAASATNTAGARLVYHEAKGTSAKTAIASSAFSFRVDATSSKGANPVTIVDSAARALWRSQPVRLYGVPNTVLYRILSYLDVLSVGRMACTSRQMRAATSEDYVWNHRLKVDKSESNGSKEHTNLPARVQFMRMFSRWSLWAYTSYANKFMRNFHSASSLNNIMVVIEWPLKEQNPAIRAHLQRALEADIIEMLKEDDEWRSPVMACVAVILLGLQNRGAEYPKVIETLWELLLETQVSDKVISKLIVAAYFGDPHFKSNAQKFVANAVEAIEECKTVSAQRSTGDMKSSSHSLNRSNSADREDGKEHKQNPALRRMSTQ